MMMTAGRKTGRRNAGKRKANRPSGTGDLFCALSLTHSTPLPDHPLSAPANGIVVAARMRTTRETAGKRPRRSLKRGCDGLLAEARPGAPQQIQDEDMEHVLALPSASWKKKFFRYRGIRRPGWRRCYPGPAGSLRRGCSRVISLARDRTGCCVPAIGRRPHQCPPRGSPAVW
jgi:hypothetical protein